MTISWISARSSIKWSGPLTDPAEGLSSRCHDILRGALVCITALFCSGSPASGRPLSENNVPPRPGAPQSSQACSANFHLSAFQANAGTINESGPGPLPFSLQEQPFSEAPVRLPKTTSHITRDPLYGRSPSGSSLRTLSSGRSIGSFSIIPSRT